MSGQACNAKPIAAKLRVLMAERGMRSEDVAAGLHVSHRTVTRWLAGSHEPTPTLGRALGDLFGVDWRDFYDAPSVEAA